MRVLFISTIAFLTAIASATTEWKVFESAEGDRTFVGRLVSYDAKKQIVTAQKKSTMRPVRFKVDLLSDEDREYVETRSAQLEAAGAFRVDFSKSIEKTGSNKSGKERRSTYDAAFLIELRNYSPEFFENIEVEYIVAYRKDAVNGPGTVATTQGTHLISVLPGNSDENIATEGVTLESYRKEGEVTGRVGST